MSLIWSESANPCLFLQVQKHVDISNYVQDSIPHTIADIFLSYFIKRKHVNEFKKLKVLAFSGI